MAENRCNGTEAGKICVANGSGRILYWSPATHRAYEVKSKGGTKISVGDFVKGVNEGGFADAGVLFDGAYNCTRDGRAGGRIVEVGGGNGKWEMDVACLSQLPMYLRCGAPCPVGAKPVQGKCPFGNWENCGDAGPMVRNGTEVPAVGGEGGSSAVEGGE